MYDVSISGNENIKQENKRIMSSVTGLGQGYAFQLVRFTIDLKQ